MRWVYTKKQHGLMTGYQRRSWGTGANPVFLNVEELATIWHFPTITIKAPLVKKSESKRAEPPSGLPITYLEETLQGYVSASEEAQMEDFVIPETSEGLDTIPPGLSFGPVSDEPLAATVPHPQAPIVREEPSSAVPLPEESDDAVPSNLPI